MPHHRLLHLVSALFFLSTLLEPSVASNQLRHRLRHSAAVKEESTILEGSCDCGIEQECMFHCQYNGGNGGFGSIGFLSCQGEGDLFCQSNGDAGHGTIGNRSCNGNTGAGGVCSMNGFHGHGIIGKGSCNKGSDLSCSYNGQHGHGEIGDQSCNQGDSDTCVFNGSSESKGIIQNNSCNTVGACPNNQGMIGNHSCNASGACQFNTGTIDDECCNYVNACSGTLGNPFSKHVTKENCECLGTCKEGPLTIRTNK